LGEDPYLVSQLGTACVRGLEENGVIATLKHFAGYAASKAARNHAPVSMGSRELADHILPSFEHAVRMGRARSVMNSYADVDGIPVAADPVLLTDVLRNAWGFTGTVVSDYGAVTFLQLMHRIASTEGEAAAILETGRPTVLVAISGRPYALGKYQGRAAAIVQALFPGEEGGAALAGVLSGRVNPSGKLPVGVPRQSGGQPYTYLAPPLGQNRGGVSNLDPTPAFPFGHGLSYTSFAYDNLRASSVELDTAGRVELTVTVRNTGVRQGDEVVQLYAADPVASVTRPVTQLIGFARVRLAPATSVEVSFTVHSDRLSFTGRTMERIVEPGEVQFRVGNSDATFAGPLAIQLTGETRTIRGERVMDTPVAVSNPR
jgi:Glycosyl hydrolase family 3 N terminal domain/Glycosyl hydrolase family 3 C-terminal domain/Fibronectin type III-like domain